MSSPLLDEFRAVVRPEGVDENDHLNMGYYVVVFDLATDVFMDSLGLTRAGKDARGVTTFTLESHVTYLRELREGDPIRITTQLLDFDSKRFHYIHQMLHEREGYLASTNELVSLHVSQQTRRAAAIDADIQERLKHTLELHSAHPRPPQAGRRIGLASGRAG